MSHIYFARHGQTYWNVENKICGSTDIELTPDGIKQAKELGEKILAEKYDIDEILCSPLKRAKKTAECVAEITGLPLRVEKRLIEQNFGRFEGTPRDSKEFRYNKENFVCNYGGGESMLRLCQRIYNLLDELKNDDKTYLLVAHNGISRAVKSYFSELTNSEFASFGIKNCEILRFDYE